MLRHDREADLPRFRNVPFHGFFINRDITNLAYTVMATGDDVVLESGERDGGEGRAFLFSSPGTCGAGLRLGNSNNDNSRKITESRDLTLRYQVKLPDCLELLRVKLSQKIRVVKDHPKFDLDQRSRSLAKI